MNAHAAAVTPVLRTVLLCDIVESTALIERLGDVRAVALLRKHDQLLREAMVLCHGQLIDKADGVLALFERPIQALDFALRYQRGLRELGESERLELQARIGIHVGDVMTWANDPKDVLAGAKAYEVEGLAKPVAARLMNLALPGQILMSGMAQNLCQRAAGELGASGVGLRWLMHGRYSFKGVPAPMLVHEVGLPGLSPLRPPVSGAKAWRELPLWRRPPVLALEVLLVGVLGVALFWTTLRSPPAIAFAERDWVVVAQLQNRTDEKIFDDSLDTALRIGLEQSQHVNLVSQLQIDRALERMQRQGQPVDRQLAAELALREGARAVILPTVAEVGGVVRVSLEVIDPGSGVTVYSESADGRGSDEVLPAMDVAMARVRGQLGEAMTSIENTSKPLEQVTTDNLQALRAYSMALRASRESRLGDAESLALEAVRLDPDFAMAYLRLAFIRYIDNDPVAASKYIGKALEHREHLTQRELLFLEGAEATLSDPARAMQKFKLLSELYPDEYRAFYNFAYFAHFDALRTDEALDMVGHAMVPQYAQQGSANYLSGVLRLAKNQYEQSIAHFDRAESLGERGFKREHAEAFAAIRRYDSARRIQQAQSETGIAGSDLEMRLIEISLPLDQGQYDQALAAAKKLQSEASGSSFSDLTRDIQDGITLLLRSYAPDDTFAADLADYAKTRKDGLAGANELQRRHLVFQAAAAGWMAAYTGDAVIAKAMRDVVAGDATLTNYPANAAILRVLEAEIALLEKTPGKAIALLKPVDDDGHGSYFERAVLMRAHLAHGDREEADKLAAWLAANRGRAFAEPNSLGLWQAANVIESNLALRARAKLASGRSGEAASKAAEAAFDAAWPRGGELVLVKRRDAAF